jgi:hypothetical protein
VAGNVWMVRDLGRANDWLVLHDDVELTHGSLAGNDAYSRATPFDLADGSGGAGVLQGIAVEAGDEIRLHVVRTSDPGDFVGVRLQVTCESIVTTTTLPTGDCGDPVGTGGTISASDALFVLKAAVGQFSCAPCVCDTNDSGSITASDALVVLKYAVGQDVALHCPGC